MTPVEVQLTAPSPPPAWLTVSCHPLLVAPAHLFPGHLSAPVNSGDQLAGNGPFWEEHFSFSNTFGEAAQNQQKRGVVTY